MAPLLLWACFGHDKYSPDNNNNKEAVEDRHEVEVELRPLPNAIDTSPHHPSHLPHDASSSRPSPSLTPLPRHLRGELDEDEGVVVMVQMEDIDGKNNNTNDDNNEGKRAKEVVSVDQGRVRGSGRPEVNNDDDDNDDFSDKE